MRSVVVALVLLLFLQSVLGAGLSASTPANGAVLDPDNVRVGFTSSDSPLLEECRLYMNSEEVKRLTYGYRPSSITYSLDLSDGEYEWYVECDTDEGETLRTEARRFTVTVTKSSNIDVTNSGTRRGSFRHSFTIENSPDQDPIIIPGVLPGDFIEVKLAIPPSRITKDLFVRTVLSDSNGKYVMLDYDFKQYKLYLGEDIAIPMGGAKMYMRFDSQNLRKLTFVATPGVKQREPEEEIDEPEEEIVEEDVPEPEPIEEPEEKPILEVTPPTPQPEPPKQGITKRFFSWLIGIFGA